MAGVALLQTDDVFSGRSGLSVKAERHFPARRDGNIDDRERLRQQYRGCERDDSILAVARAGPQGGLRQTRQTATAQHVCCQICISLPSRQQSDLSEYVSLCAVVSVETDISSLADVSFGTLILMSLVYVSLPYTCRCIWLPISQQAEEVVTETSA
jgi:hypothetical protein